jgi:hypothetical protein
MAKTAQQKFNEYLDECHSTTDAINAFVNASQENYNGYAYAAGALTMILADAISELPKARRADFRDRLNREAQKQKNELLAKMLKETA